MNQAALTTAKWTVEEYHRLIENGFLDDKHVELLNGEIVEMPPEGIPHASLSSDSADYLRALLGDRAKVREAKPITLPNNSEPEPDIAIVQLPSSIYRAHHPYPENIFWLIEYSNSSLTKDLEVKTTVYAQSNILEYWVVDLRGDRLIVFRSPKGDEYEQRITLTSGTISPLAFPDLAIAVSHMLA
ncbi:Uma2 family endonuclease [Cyanobacteria bacterium FACHB-471]|nr:Uma2 family endonuclease [Cyanobacteria bacterium FACHB-471]